MTLLDFLDALANTEPTPGGGTASAFTGAMGASLLMMVAGLPRTRGNTAEERTALDAARAALLPLRQGLAECADRDTEAFNLVMAAYRLAKATPDEIARRRAAIQDALRAATDVPLETLRLSVEALETGVTVATHGNPSAASDAGVAAGLLLAAGEGAAANVRINLDGVKDERYRAATAAAVDGLLARGSDAAARLRQALG